MPIDYSTAGVNTGVIDKLYDGTFGSSCDRCASLQARKEAALCKLLIRPALAMILPEVNIDKDGMAKITTRGDGV